MTGQPSQEKHEPRDWFWSPVSTASFALLLGVPALITGHPWLFPSLGPTMFLKVHAPRHISARPYNTLMGHGVAVLAGAIAVLLTGANQDPSVFASGAFTAPRFWASVLGLPLGCFLQVALRATHSPAASTTLLITMGSFTVNAEDMVVLAVGILAVTVIGEVAYRLRARFSSG
jgi:hypothetical protein